MECGVTQILNPAVSVVAGYVPGYPQSMCCTYVPYETFPCNSIRIDEGSKGRSLVAKNKPSQQPEMGGGVEPALCARIRGTTAVGRRKKKDEDIKRNGGKKTRTKKRTAVVVRAAMRCSRVDHILCAHFPAFLFPGSCGVLFHKWYTCRL